MRRVGLTALFALLFIAPIALPVAAQQAEDWASSLKWGDGREVQWQAKSSPGCDGSNVNVRLVNGSRLSGAATMKSVTFACKRGGEFVSSERALGVVPAGSTSISSPIQCACAEKGGVKDLTSVDLDFQLEGQGEDVSANGCSYKGSYASGKRSGQGLYVCQTGYRLEGFFLNDQPNGPGKETLATGQSYTGDFVNGQRQGHGQMTYADGANYDGAFKNGLREGLGTMRYKDGSIYVGDWRADKRVGHGTYTGPGGSWSYDGEWNADIRSGQGKLTYSDGSYLYEGGFMNDVREGQGSATFMDGRIFKGAFVKGEQIGPGQLIYPDGRKIVGDFKDHRPNGHATDTSADATYDGEWVDGMLQGNVKVTYANGVHFEGQYIGGKRNGLGQETLSDGSKLECRYVNDVPDKKCTKVTPKGARIEYRN